MSARPRLLVIGANGFIGAHLVHAAAGRFACTPAARTKCEVLVDIGDPASVAAAFGKSRPHTVVLLAAMADIDRCQREPGAARETNVAGAWNVARECARAARDCCSPPPERSLTGPVPISRRQPAHAGK